MASNNDDLTEIQFRRARKHAKATAESNEKRKAKGAPRREDFNRAAYYALLMITSASETTEPERDRMRILLISMLVRAGFDKAQCRALFQQHNEDVIKDLNAWLAQRWHEESRRLKKDRGPYVPFDMKPRKVGWKGRNEAAAAQSAAEAISAAE